MTAQTTARTTAQELSFGVNVGRSPEEALAGARWAEQAGFDVVTVADHLGSVSPFVMLSCAAAVTERVRLRTYVLNVGFWHPALLARDAATLDAVSGGRLELGLGAGHSRDEHASAGLDFPGFGERIAALDVFARHLRDRLADPAQQPAPVQRPVPVFVAAMSDAGLDVAARHGDLVALSGLTRPGSRQAPGRPPGRFTLVSAARTDEQVARVQAARAAAGRPPARLDALLQQAVVDRDPGQVADEWAAEPDAPYSAADVLDSPFVLLADSPAQAAAELRRRSDRWGITSWCTHTASGPALAAVIKQLRS